MKNKKRKFAALALCVTLLVGLLATTFSSADDFNVPQEPIVLAGAEGVTNIERIQSCYNSNLQTIITNANLTTDPVKFRVLEIYPGEAGQEIPETTFSTYIKHEMFARDILTYNGVSVPADSVELTRITSGTLSAIGSKEDILNNLKNEYDLVYVNNTDLYDKKGEASLSEDISEDVKNMFFEGSDFSAEAKEALIDYATLESAPLLMDYNIYKYLEPSTLPGSTIIDPDKPVNLNISYMVSEYLTQWKFTQSSAFATDGRYVFSVDDSVLNNTEGSILTSENQWMYDNEKDDNLKPKVEVNSNGEYVITSTAQYKILEIVPKLPENEDGKTELQRVVEEEPSKTVNYPYEVVITVEKPEVEEDKSEEGESEEGESEEGESEEGESEEDEEEESREETVIEYIQVPHKITRFAEWFLTNELFGGDFSIDVCTPGSIPSDLSEYTAIFVNIGSEDYATVAVNDITETEMNALKEYAKELTRNNQTYKRYMYFRESIGALYNDNLQPGESLLTVDYAYEIVSNFINKTTNKSKYSNVVLVDYLFLENNEGPDKGKIDAIKAMINTAAYKGILPGNSNRKFNVLEIQPAAPIPFNQSSSASIDSYYKNDNNKNVSLEERIYVTSAGEEFYYLYRPQGNLKQGGYDYNGPIKAVYTDGKGNYYYTQNNSEYDDFIMKSDVALLVQPNTYADKKIGTGDSSDLGIRAIYKSIKYNGKTYEFQKTWYSNTSKTYEVLYSNGSEIIYIGKKHVWLKQDITEDFYAKMETVGDPIGYVSHDTQIDSKIDGNKGDFDYDFEYVLFKENVLLDDGVNPEGPYTMYVKPETGYFLYEDAQGNVYVPKGYDTNLRRLARATYSPQAETDIYSYHITKSKIADLIGIDESKINIDNYTVSELNCKVDDLVNTYDLVVIGGDVSALREFKNNNKSLSSTYRRKMTVNDKYAYDMYFHTGDIIQRNRYYEDGNSANSVLIGTQRNKDGKYVYITSGMDLSYTKQQELYTYINSGRPVLIEAEVIDSNNNVSKRIDPVSYMGVMLGDIANGKKSGSYQNILTGFDYDDYKKVDGKTVYNDNTKSNIVAVINSDVSIIRPTLNIVSKPEEYQETLPKSAYAKNGHIFTVEYNIGSEAGNGMDYDVNLYFDVDMDGRFSDNEIYATQKYRTGRDKNMFIEYELVDTFFGILSWKLEATYKSANGAVTQVSQLGYAGFDRDAKYNNDDAYLETIKVLQIVPKINANLEMCVTCDDDTRGSIKNHTHEFGIRKYVGEKNTGGTNQGNWMDGFVFKDYFDIQLTIQTCENFCAEAYDKTLALAENVRNENWLIDSYDMIVVGFADSYGNTDFTKVACQELIKFSEVNGLLCSHDNISIIHSGAKYDKDFYGVQKSETDPDNYARKPSTTYGYNMSHYYNPKDKVYNSSVRYIYGAARFFTLDSSDPYTNDQDGSEFYTNYGVTNGPTEKFMGGVFGGQTDACLGWRIQGDTSPYKNDKYAGKYNNTFVVNSTNDGIITRYPFSLPKRFTIVETHSQYAQIDLDVESTSIWYTLDATVRGQDPIYNSGETLDKEYNQSLYKISPNDGRNNYYIYSNKNVTYTGAGHADIVAGYDNNYERKLFINTVFLSFNSKNNAPIIRLKGEGITDIAEGEVEEGMNVDAKVTLPTVDSTVEFELNILDDLADREFTGLIYINKVPDEVNNGKDYDPTSIKTDYYNPEEDILLGVIIKDGSNANGYKYYDLLKNNETSKITDIQMEQSYFDDLTSTSHISIEIFDRVKDLNKITSNDTYEQQRTVKTKHSIYTIRVVAENVIDMDLWELN